MTPVTDAPTTTVGNARRMGAAAIRDAARTRARGMLRRSGARAARLDRSPVPHHLMLAAIRRALPRRFDPEAADDLEATFELRIRDPAGGEPERFELKVSRGSCIVGPGAATSPGATATLGADDLIRLVSGDVGWPELLSNGRLELSGDPFLALRFPNLFRLPASAAD